TEFAFSGVGFNPHYGTPGNPVDRARVPGGSSSGAGVAAADGMCDIALGTDTGGSVRIPAALCGIVGFKPSRQRVPTRGAFPLSFTLDSIGPLAKTVEQCFHADAVMAGEAAGTLSPAPLKGLRFAVLENASFTPHDATVSSAFAAGLDTLRKAGVVATPTPFPFLDAMLAVNPKGGFPVPEAFSIHRERLATRGEDFDPHVRARIGRGGQIAAADYIDLIQVRNRLVREIDGWMEDFDALVLPTTPIVAPTIAEVQDPDTFVMRNTALLSNTAIMNFFDLCAVSLPLPVSGLHVGLMLVVRNGQDKRLLRIARAVEQLFGG
ncbi:MAG: amidase, partial [Rhizobiales bacterium]|nr:amidase [Hyphomicrobiales bacterium]